MNLLKETKINIKLAGKTPEDIIFIGSVESGHACTWEQFEILANVDYDNGCGGQEVADDLVIVFEDRSYLQRKEYDGKEWWEYVQPLVIPSKTQPIKSLITDRGWASLEDIEEEESNF